MIDMRYENPLYMAEDAGAADLISGGRLQLGISRGSPEQVIDGWRYFGYVPQEGETNLIWRAATLRYCLMYYAVKGLQSLTHSRCSKPAGIVASGAAFRRLTRSYLVGGWL